MIIALCGLKHSGKDTVAAYLVKNHGYERRAFADPVKKSIAGLFDIPFALVDKLKNDPNCIVSVDDGKQHHDMTFRQFIQRFATEAHRDLPEMGDDFWVDLTLPVQGFYEGRSLVVTDLRFKSEARRIKQLDGMIVEVHREGIDNQDPHRSEQEFRYLEVDYTIYNNGSIDDLYVGAELMLENIARLATFYGYGT